MNTFIYVILAAIGVYLLFRLFNAKPSGYKNISSDELNALIKEKKVNLIDVRSKAEMKSGVIGKPSWLELNGSFKEKASKLDKDKTYVVYCRSGRRSAIASKMLAGLGFANVFNLSGGFMSYRK
ncbi:rhodanese-like domain-containing protein [Portibacter lacus]|uniref:Rhodanese-like domain-containing protein n=1 Tax=Portibacter lacus TaxID=1099794 RepID=A0AA37SPN6_9BACT|nr:rhodanese-like domain-containing protein [Portibacter lacus]GLR17680.1 rhodanese-like domain-containing protein [Portibacter lacus]